MHIPRSGGFQGHLFLWIPRDSTAESDLPSALGLVLIFLHFFPKECQKSHLLRKEMQIASQLGLIISPLACFKQFISHLKFYLLQFFPLLICTSLQCTFLPSMIMFLTFWGPLLSWAQWTIEQCLKKDRCRLWGKNRSRFKSSSQICLLPLTFHLFVHFFSSCDEVLL